MERWADFQNTEPPTNSVPNLVQTPSTRLIDIGNNRHVDLRPFGRASQDFGRTEVLGAVEFHARGRQVYQVIPSKGQSPVIPLGVTGRFREEVFMELTSAQHNIDEKDAREVVEDLTDHERFVVTEVWHDRDHRQIGLLTLPPPDPTSSPTQVARYILRVLRGKY